MVLVAVFFISIILIEVPEMLKERRFKELRIFSILTFLGLILWIFYVLRISIFNPAKIIEYIVKDTLHISYK
ncbi:hypothetical protein JHL18_12705 [Clostridium sp. YIM B02505]|uniref:Uncharacterized protein n=1 Tax=Clostridium yunnanense TaxID=2800325 RepID=A0ABS1EQ48_9CLOT|nr:hypothetical protein [Clostridium yunnanense]MBK1811481.1 hypothetical protein [Clostridium yunnanense]